LVSALLSDIPAYSFGEALAWVRFPLFVMASAFWLAKDRRVFTAMILMSFIGLMVMLGILTAEILLSETLSSRLSWPYDDVVSGAYLAKFGLFSFLVLLGVFFTYRGTGAILAGMMAFAVLVMTLMTGERVSFVLLIAAGCLFTALTAKSFFKTAALLAAIGCILVAAFAFMPNLKHRYTTSFLTEIINQDSGIIWCGAVVWRRLRRHPSSASARIANANSAPQLLAITPRCAAIHIRIISLFRFWRKRGSSGCASICCLSGQ
jgi:hypothetical protein